MNLFSFLLENPNEVGIKLLQHLYLFAVSWAIAVVVGISIAILATRRGHEKIGRVVLSVTGAAQSVPSIAIIAIVFIFLGIGAAPAIVALFLYSLVPITFNSASGFMSVEPAMKEAARGMGMTERQILRKVELPVSIPAIASGARSAATINIGTATIAAVIGAGGLGEIIFVGLRLTNQTMIFAGALPAALLAVVVDALLALVERGLTSPGIQFGRDEF